MANATATCTCTSCGHTFKATRGNFHKRSEADSWEKWAADTLDECPECRKARKEREQAELLNSRPALTGSEKQIKWATAIREKLIKQYQADCNTAIANAAYPFKTNIGVFTSEAELRNFTAALFEDAMAHTSSSWWIDHREEGALAFWSEDAVNRVVERIYIDD